MPIDGSGCLKMSIKRKAKAASPRKRILIVDDHPVMREGIVQWIRQTSDLEVCGQVETVAQALSLVKNAKPDLVLTDILLLGQNGLELVKELHVSNPALPVLVLSMQDELLFARSALLAGARGYIMKGAGGDRVVEAIREILQGHIVLSPAAKARLQED